MNSPIALKFINGYGIEVTVTEQQLSEWLDDLHEGVDELMHQPLSVTHPLAFCAPEVVRGHATALVIQSLNSGTGPVKLVLSSGDSYDEKP